MKKIASIVSLALAATGIASGCAVDAVDGANPETVDTVEGAICSPTAQDNAVSAMFANLATTMAIEFKRMNFTRDLEVYQGGQYQQMLRVTAASRALCGPDQCRATDALLAFQNPAWYQKKFVFSNGTELDPWTFSARLVAGWNAQKVCEDRFRQGNVNACVTEPHYLDKVSVQPVAPACGIGNLSLVTFKASKADMNGNKLSPEQPLSDISKIQRRYLWTDQDQNLPVNDNEFMRFSTSADGIYVTTDPGEGGYPDPGSSGSCPTALLKFSYTNAIQGTCCSYNQGANMWYQPLSVVADGSGYYKCVNKPT
jgi:N-acetylmuramoyl-L-alanine amidase